MLCIRELTEQFDIQGAYCIKMLDDDVEDIKVVASGNDFECEYYDIEDKYMEMEIVYMYAVDGVLNIEIEA